MRAAEGVRRLSPGWVDAGPWRGGGRCRRQSGRGRRRGLWARGSDACGGDGDQSGCVPGRGVMVGSSKEEVFVDGRQPRFVVPQAKHNGSEEVFLQQQ